MSRDLAVSLGLIAILAAAVWFAAYSFAFGLGHNRVDVANGAAAVAVVCVILFLRVQPDE